MKKLTLLLGLTLAASGCLAPTDLEESDEEGIATEAEDIVGGSASFSLPAIGMLATSGACTATLISSRVILTAAHCFNFNNTLSGLATPTTPPFYYLTGRTGTFTITKSATESYTYDVLRFAVLGSGLGANDVAVAELASDVPSTVASPLTVASSSPSSGATVTQYGYGCTSRAWDPATDQVTGVTYPWVKNRYSFSWAGLTKKLGSTVNSAGNCFGDSGGPVVNSSNQIVGLSSYLSWSWIGQKLTSITAGFANPATNRGWITNMTAFYGNKHLCDTCTKVSLKTSGGKYVSARNGVVDATKTSVGATETFRRVNLGDIIIGLQASTGQFVSFTNLGGSTVTASANVAREAEAIWRMGSSGQHLMSWNWYYMSATNGGGSTVTAKATSAGTNEKFTMTVIP